MTPADRAVMRSEVLVSTVTQESGSFSTWPAGENFAPMPLTWIDAEQANLLPMLHKDPVDRMLIAQALRHKTPIVTQDHLFASYGAAVVWYAEARGGNTPSVCPWHNTEQG